MFELMKLPFKDNALAPVVSAETIGFHYAKHHQAYVDKVNELIAGTEFQDMSLEEIIERTYDKPEYQVLYNNAGQVFNHNFYWNSIGFGERIDADLDAKIKEHFETSNLIPFATIIEYVIGVISNDINTSIVIINFATNLLYFSLSFLLVNLIDEGGTYVGRNERVL